MPQPPKANPIRAAILMANAAGKILDACGDDACAVLAAYQTICDLADSITQSRAEKAKLDAEQEQQQNASVLVIDPRTKQSVH